MFLPAPTRPKRLVIALGAVIVALAIALNVGWIVVTWKEGLQLALGIAVSMLIITGVVLNTVFLVREMRRNEQHDAFINAVTHELKTPVASIRLSLETMLTRQVDEAKRRQFHEHAIEDCDRLLHTIDQVLRAGQAGAAKRVRGALVNLSETVQECLRLARARHHLDEAELRFAGPADDPAPVTGDADELKAAISNLIDNAVKYSGGRVDVTVEIERGPERDFLVRVRDRGIGIPAGELDRIFKRFYRIPGAGGGRVKGMGLGLYIVSSVAKRHGGAAWAESAGQDRGCVFTLRLPMAKEAA